MYAMKLPLSCNQECHDILADVTRRSRCIPTGAGHFTLHAGSHVSHDDVIKWKHFPRYWLFVRRIHRSPVNSPHKSQWRGALMFSLICAWIKVWVHNGEAGNLRRHRVHYDVTVMRTDRPTNHTMYLFNISRNAPLWNRNVHISLTKWCIVGYGTGDLISRIQWYLCLFNKTKIRASGDMMS